MSAEAYLTEAGKLVEKIHRTQLGNIQKAAEVFATSIIAKRAVHVFGSGHSIIPVLDIFPRYGSFVGFHPIMDPRLMWFNIVGPGGARELLWLEREPGYIKNVLLSHNLVPPDSMLVISHGGLNAAGVEMALEAKAKGLTVVALTSLDNRRLYTKPNHSSGKALADIADIVIDNCSPAEDAVIDIEGVKGKVAATSTLAFVTLVMSLLAETAAELARRGHAPERVFVSPNVPDVPSTNNQRVFEDYEKFERSLYD